MKKWTVMLIPHEPGDTRTYTLSSWHSRLLVALLAGLVFTSSCMYQWNRQLRVQSTRVAQENWLLQVQKGGVEQPAATPTAPQGQEVRDVEERLRAEYQASLAAITAELTDLYNMEAKARDITGMAPRPTKAAERITESVSTSSRGGGKGGPSSSGVELAMDSHQGASPRLPNVIYGVSRPSADLIIQEIRLRTRSFRELVQDMEVARSRVERTPSIWPLANGAGRKTSGFGYRRDPFNGRISQHSGTDLSAPIGTPIRATGRGVVAKSALDGDFGNMVIIDHGNGLQTLYGHMSKRIAVTGQTVKRGDIIGALGSTGRSTGPHLHYEVHIGGKPVDPDKYLRE